MRTVVPITIALILLLLSSGCASSRFISEETPRTLAKSDEQIEKVNIREFPGADSSKLDYLPIITPPEILRVWVYDHVTPVGDMVVGHWVFLRLRESQWYLEENDKRAASISRSNTGRIPFTWVKDKGKDNEE